MGSPGVMGDQGETQLKGDYGLTARSSLSGERINILYRLPRLLVNGVISIYNEKGKLVKNIEINGMNGLISINIWEIGGSGSFHCILTENGSVKYHDSVIVAGGYS